MTPVKIAFGSTNYGPLWRPAAESWLRCVAYTQRHLVREGLGEITGVGLTDRTYTHSADNTLVRDCLADESFTHLAHTEADMLLPDDALVRLLAAGAPGQCGVGASVMYAHEWAGRAHAPGQPITLVDISGQRVVPAAL